MDGRPTGAISLHHALSFDEGPHEQNGRAGQRVFLGHAWLSFLPEILREHLKMKTGRMWDFTYQGFYAIFEEGLSTLGLGKLVPNQLRHSGASIDAYGRRRSQDEIRRRGHWEALKSVARYEKSGRLELTWNQFGATKRAFMEACQLHLKGTLRGLSVPVLRE